MITSAIKKQTSDCYSISLYPYIWYFKLRIMGKKRKRKAILLLAFIADVSCLTNRSFYMRTLLRDRLKKLLIKKPSLMFLLLKKNRRSQRSTIPHKTIETNEKKTLPSINVESGAHLGLNIDLRESILKESE